MRAAVLAVALLAMGATALAQAEDVTSKDITLCQQAVKLVTKLDGVTILCPTDDAFLEFAEVLGFDTEEPGAELIKNFAKYSKVLKPVFENWVVPGVMPVASIRTSLKTVAGTPVTVTKTGATSFELTNPLVDPEEGTVDNDNYDATEATDLTFEGKYSAKSKYVVHVFDRVLIPTSVAPTIAATAKAIAAAYGN